MAAKKRKAEQLPEPEQKPFAVKPESEGAKLVADYVKALLEDSFPDVKLVKFTTPDGQRTIYLPDGTINSMASSDRFDIYWNGAEWVIIKDKNKENKQVKVVPLSQVRELTLLE